jgi:putative transposase
MIWSILAQLCWLGRDVVTVLRQSEREKTVEVLLLRQQRRILERKQRRAPRVSRWEKLTLAVLSARLKGRDRLSEIMLLFKPETVLRWHRELVRRKWTFQQAKRRAGHPALDPEVEALIVQLARDNPRLGYKKLVGELRKLGYRVGRSTVRDVLKRHHTLGQKTTSLRP